jgi:hypothetical protein
MRVDDKRPDARRNQMIECEGNKWFVENRDQWLGKIIGQRPQPCAQTSAENKSLCDLYRHCGLNGLERPACQLKLPGNLW